MGKVCSKAPEVMSTPSLKAFADKPVEQVAGLSGKKCLVLYGTSMGNCEGLAKRAKARYSAMGFSCEMASLDKVASKTPPAIPTGDEGIVLLITCSYNGQPPENAKEFGSFLKSGSAVAAKFEAATCSVFAVGNKAWAATYLHFPTAVNSALKSAGATMLTDMGEGDENAGVVDSQFARWCMACQVSISKKYGLDTPLPSEGDEFDKFKVLQVSVEEGQTAASISLASQQALFEGHKVSPEWGSVHPFVADIAANRELLTAQEGRSTRHIEVALPEGHTYVAGDHLGVLGGNPFEVVIAYLRRVGMPPDAVVKVQGEGWEDVAGHSLGCFQALQFGFDLQQPATRPQLHYLSGKGTGATKERLHALASFESDEFEKHVAAARRTLLEILEEFPDVKLEFGELLALLPDNKPRYYSISSSPKVMPKAVTITVSVVQGKSPSGRAHLGCCSNYLASHPRTAPEEVFGKDGKAFMPVQVYVKNTGSAFRLPISAETPIIMVGPGTGFAPMRGFIQERAAGGAKNNLLFFGCRNDDDYIYRDELEAWQKEGILESHVAFSRKEGTPKTYVQHVIAKEEPRVKELIQMGAHIYVCGDASRMAPDVRRAFGVICGEDGDAIISKMVDEGRYCQDVWAAQSGV